MIEIAILVGGTLFPSVAFAHPEHASDGDFSLLHYLTDPFHVGLMVVAVVVVLAARRSMLCRRTLRRPVR